MNSRWKYFVVSGSTCLVILLLVGARHTSNADESGDQYRHLAVYTEVLSRIKTDYVEEPNMKSVTLGALNGLLESIDPYASYLNADQYKQYLATKDENRASVGLVLSKRMGYIGIVDSIPGSPAAKANLTTGDILESINGVSTRDMPLVYGEILLEGAPGSSVEIGILRYSHPDPQKITMTREMIHYPPVTAKLLADQVGLIQVPALDAARVNDVKTKLQELQAQGAKRIVLDLRNDSVGTPQSGIDLADLFIKNGLITYLEGQKVPRQNFDADGKAVTALPVAVITNRGTADGAEIAAAAMLDDKRAEVVGERTYGDAGMRKPITMEDGSALILSVAKYYSPGGKAIQDTGVTPSVPVAEVLPGSDDDDLTPDQTPAPKGEDLLLKKAIEVLTTGSKTAANAAAAAPMAGLAPKMTPLHVPTK
jgi:carboxyl-terminal processing protease